jgi:hypothetical protein
MQFSFGGVVVEGTKSGDCRLQIVTDQTHHISLTTIGLWLHSLDIPSKGSLTELKLQDLLPTGSLCYLLRLAIGGKLG